MTKYSFDEFKLMYDSTEKVTDRRLAINKTNYSINIAFIVAIAIVWNWGFEGKNYYFIAMFFIFIISTLSVFFCKLWLKQIISYKNLNTYKFEVLSEMAENIHFETSNPVEIISYKPLDKEWIKMRESDSLETKKATGYNPLGSSTMETFMPKAFQIIFFITMFISIVSIILNPTEVFHNIRTIINF